MEQIAIKKIYGSAGCGKTTYLMGILEEHLKSTPVYKIQYVGFTVTSCSVAQKRGAKYAPELLKDRMWFRTIHSTCLELTKQYWKQNNIKFKQVIDWQEKNDFCHFAELDLPRKDDDATDGSGDLSTGSAFFATATYMINSQLPLEEWQKCPHAASMIKEAIDFKQIFTEYNTYKKQRNLIDYDDMLLLCYENKLNPPTTVLIVDEAQDLSPLQYGIIKNWMVGKTHIYMGGDDDQTIFTFLGASSELMLDYEKARAETVVLPKTYRCPKQIWNPANALISRNKVRQPKNVQPSNQTGSLKIIRKHELTSLAQHINPNVDVFLLARTNNIISYLAWHLADEQILFTYTDSKKEALYGWTPEKIKIMNTVAQAPVYTNRKNLLLNLMTKAGLAKYDTQLHTWKYGEVTYNFMEKYIGVTIDYTKIKTKIGTIHSVKGEEAVIVILFNDITAKIADAISDEDDEKTIEDERKVWYVGMTRSKLILVIVDGYFARETKGFTYREICEQNQKPYI